MLTSDFGTKLDNVNRTRILTKICSVLGIDQDPDAFIGSHPISLTRESINTLLSEDYFVCEKSDGIRIVLVVCDSILFLYDRNCDVFQTKYAIPCPDIYVFDGELYQETDYYVFAAFDCLVFGGEDCTKKTLDKRLKRAFEFTRKIAPGKLVQNTKLGSKSFRLVTKEMMKSYGFHQILDGISRLKHKNDGLIFTPLADPYKVRQRTRIFKWKPPHLNTVDFYVVKTQRSGEYRLYASANENQVSVSKGNLCSGMLLFGSYYDVKEELGDGDVIAEFCYDTSKEVFDLTDFTVTVGGWDLYKVRSDKKSPNNVKTVLNVVESIEEGIGETELLKYWGIMAQNYKEREKAQSRE